MIKIAGNIYTKDELMNKYEENSIERKTIDILASSNKVYEYNSLNQFQFELQLRANIVLVSKELHKSDFAFKVFRKSMCNPKYWIRTEEGGFLLKKDIKPSDAILDIFINSSQYGTECATAIVIIFYKAVLNLFPVELFNKLFADIYLMSWNYLDSDLGIAIYSNLTDYLPGDCRYFKNPDVNPLTPEWQGENVIDLGNGMYYGHGIGIATNQVIIEFLNMNRRSGDVESAYLMDFVLRPNFKYLSNQYYSFTNLANRFVRYF